MVIAERLYLQRNETGSIMISVGISCDGLTYLVVLARGGLFAGTLDNGFILMEDNAHPKCGPRFLGVFYRKGNPDYSHSISPVLNPTDNMWNEYYICHSDRLVHQNYSGLRASLVEEWNIYGHAQAMHSCLQQKRVTN